MIPLDLLSQHSARLSARASAPRQAPCPGIVCRPTRRGRTRNRRPRCGRRPRDRGRCARQPVAGARSAAAVRAFKAICAGSVLATSARRSAYVINAAFPGDYTSITSALAQRPRRHKPSLDQSLQEYPGRVSVQAPWLRSTVQLAQLLQGRTSGCNACGSQLA